MEPADLIKLCQNPSSVQWEELVLWKDLLLTDATWENFQHLLCTFPDHLEDKVKLLLQSNVMLQTLKQGKKLLTYSRRAKKGADTPQESPQMPVGLKE